MRCGRAFVVIVLITLNTLICVIVNDLHAHDLLWFCGKCLWALCVFEKVRHHKHLFWPGL